MKRVLRPTYASRNKVWMALARSPNQELTRPELLKQTGLDPHTLSATCKFFISLNCVSRSVLKGYKGRSHRVKFKYIGNRDMYSALRSWVQRKREATARRQWESAFASLIDYQQKFWETHRKEIAWIRSHAEPVEVMMCRHRYNWFMCLVHQMRLLGPKDAFNRFLDQLTHLRVSKFQKWVNSQAYSLKPRSRQQHATRNAYFSQLANEAVKEDIASGDISHYPRGPTTIANWLENFLGLPQETTWEKMRELGYA